MIAHLLSTLDYHEVTSLPLKLPKRPAVEGLRAPAAGHPDLRARLRRLARPLSRATAIQSRSAAKRNSATTPTLEIADTQEPTSRTMRAWRRAPP